MGSIKEDVKIRAAVILEKIYLPLESLIEREKEKPGKNKLFLKDLSILAASLKRESKTLLKEAVEDAKRTKRI